MLHVLVVVTWIGLIFATALSFQFLLNWLLTLTLGVYLLLRWRAKRPRRALHHQRAPTTWSSPYARSSVAAIRPVGAHSTAHSTTGGTSKASRHWR
jgi:hypothetical protein